MNVLLVAANQGTSSYEMKGFLSPALGLHRIKSYLELNDHKCNILEPSLTDPEHYIIKHGSFYDIIGFSPLHVSLERDLGLIHLAKTYSGSMLIVGGIEATLNPNIFKKLSPIDYIIHGEGEKPLLSLCNGNFVSCNPLTEEEFRKITTEIDFRKIPYDIMWKETRERHPTISENESNTIRLVTSSHCPMGCTFCSSTRFLKGKTKYLTGDDIVQIIGKAVNAWPQTRQIFFHDDNFLLGKKGKERWKKISDIVFPIPFMGQARLDDITSETINYLNNFRLISIGVESFSQNILNEFKKSLKSTEIDERIELLIEAGINVFINIILTSPNCEKEDVEFTIDKCEEWINRGVALGINLCVNAYPGTEIVDKEEVTYKEVQIPNTQIKFKKMWKILPKNHKIKRALLKTECDLEGSVLLSSERSKLMLKKMRKYLND